MGDQQDADAAATARDEATDNHATEVLTHAPEDSHKGCAGPAHVPSQADGHNTDRDRDSQTDIEIDISSQTQNPMRSNSTRRSFSPKRHLATIRGSGRALTRLQCSHLNHSD